MTCACDCRSPGVSATCVTCRVRTDDVVRDRWSPAPEGGSRCPRCALERRQRDGVAAAFTQVLNAREASRLKREVRYAASILAEHAQRGRVPIGYPKEVR